jgi:predicted nucleic acid-binding protein
VDEVAVINASPLIFLTRGAQMGLLAKLAHRVVVPQPVAQEILQRGRQDITAQALQQSSSLSIVPVDVIPKPIEQWGLGDGESSVLALAQSTPGAMAVIDDLAARKCAQALRIPVRGTLGVVLLAKQRGWIPQARPVLEDLIRGGMYLSRSVLDEALRRVDE